MRNASIHAHTVERSADAVPIVWHKIIDPIVFARPEHKAIH